MLRLVNEYIKNIAKVTIMGTFYNLLGKIRNVPTEKNAAVRKVVTK